MPEPGDTGDPASTEPVSVDPGAQGLTRQSARGFAWKTGGQILAQPITTLTTVVLARLLEPRDFGLMSMCAVFINIADTVNAFGLNYAIPQKKTLSVEETESLFWFNLFVGVALFGLAVLVAPVVAAVYRQPALKALFPVMSLGLLIGSFNLIQRSLMVREMRFRVVATGGLISAVVSAAVSIPLAILGKGVWSLVIGYLVALMANVVYTQVVVRFWPRPRLKWGELAPFLRFGGASAATDVATEGLARADSLIIGRWLGASTLGAYSLAFNLMSFPMRRVAKAVADVTLPAFARIQDDLPRFKSAYARATESTALIAIPLLSASLVVGHEVVVGLYGPKWTAAALPFQVMCIAGVARSFSSLTSVVFKGTGNPHIETWWSVAGVVALVGCVAAGLPWGIVGVAVGLSVSAILTAVPMQIWANRLIGMSMFEFAKLLVPSAVIALGSALASAVIRTFAIRSGLPDIVTAFLSVGGSLALVWSIARNTPWLRRVRQFEQVLIQAVRRSEPPSPSVSPAPLD